MKQRLLPLTLLFVANFACAQHTHGEGRLDVAIEGGKISLMLEMPLDAAVGFERAPKNDKEKAALAATAKTLEEDALYLPTPAARCTLQSKEVRVPFTGGDDKPAHAGETHHADITATHLYVCANPTALEGIETTLFKSFKRLYRVEVQRVGPTGQGKQRLTPKQPVLSW